MTPKSKSILTLIILSLITAATAFYGKSLCGLNVFWTFQVLQWSQLLLIYALASTKVSSPSMKTLLIFYVLSRILLFTNAPLFEDDYFRYLWDGKVLNSGINPFKYAPNNPALNFLNSSWREHINYPEVNTIYPPLAQLYFSLIYYVFGESLFGLRLGAVTIEILSSLILIKFIRRQNLSLKPLAIFLFFPTLMKENINSVHFDGLATIFVTLVFFSLYERDNTLLKERFLTGFYLALGTLTKIFPIVFVPLVYAHQKSLSFLFGFILIILIFYFPFFETNLSIFSGTKSFASDWQFFESFAAFFIDYKYSRYYLCFILGALILCMSYLKKIRLEHRFISVFLIIFLFSTVLNSWYWLWCLPLLILFSARLLWLLPVYTSLGYSWFFDEKLYYKLHSPYYGFLILGLTVYSLMKNQDGLLRWKI